MNKLKVVFFGTPDFSVPCLEALYNNPLIDIISVVSMPDRKQGRGLELKSPEVIQFAKDKNISHFQTENINLEQEYLEKLISLKVDLFIVLAFAQFLATKVLTIPSQGAFNIHTSILPKYRGAAPIQYAILNGDKETGVSIQKMVKKMDAGDLVFQLPTKIGDNETGGELYARLKVLAAEALNEFIKILSQDKVTYTPQDEAKVTIAPTLKREDGYLDFTNETVKNIKNKVRAFYPWPGTFCYLNEKRLKVFKIETDSKSLPPGEVTTVYNQLIIGCKDGSIRLSEIQLAGKKSCTDTELLNGFKHQININIKDQL